MDRYKKAQQTLIKRFGSIEAYKKHMASIGSRGGKNGDNRPFRDKKIAIKAAKASAISRGKKK